MAITNQERVGKALELLKDGLGPFVEREVQDKIKAGGVHMDTIRRFVDDPHLTDKPIDQWDVAALLKLMWETWNDVFRNVLGQAERSLVSEIRGHRNKWAHQDSFSSDDADRTLDSIARLLTAVSASQADEVNRMKMELRRLVFEEQARSERRRGAGTTVESQATGSLKPWREVVNPHQDVASGGYQQAEFAADLWQVHLGEGTDEYRNPRRILSPHLSDGKPEEPTKRSDAATERSGRRSGGRATDQLRRRQDPLHASPIPSIFWNANRRVAGHRRSDSVSRSRRPARSASNESCWSATKSRPATHRQKKTVLWSRRCGANWPGNSAARRHSTKFARTMSAPPTQATPSAS